MPKKTPTKEADDARTTELQELQDKLKRQEQELAALRPRDGVISTPAMGLNNPWHNTSLLNFPGLRRAAGASSLRSRGRSWL